MKINNKKIKLVRVDNRLLHATVVLNWGSFVNVDTVIVIDDETYVDPFIEKVLQLSFPNKKLRMFSVNDLDKYFQVDSDKIENIIIIIKNVSLLREVVACNNPHIDEVQFPSPSSRLLLKPIESYFSKKDIENIKYLQEHKNIKFYFQTAPIDTKNYSYFEKNEK